MRAIVTALLLLPLLSATASAQSISLQGSAGRPITDSGYSGAAGIGFSPTSRLTLLAGVEQTHVPSRFTSDGRGGGSATRGGTLTFASAELQAALLPRDRVSPYVLGGFGLGRSRPNVNSTFPDPVTNDVRAFFVGGGLHVPLGTRFSVFGDARMLIGAEAGELLAVAPVRVGVSWRF